MFALKIQSVIFLHLFWRQTACCIFFEWVNFIFTVKVLSIWKMRCIEQNNYWSSNLWFTMFRLWKWEFKFVFFQSKFCINLIRCFAIVPHYKTELIGLSFTPTPASFSLDGLYPFYQTELFRIILCLSFSLSDKLPHKKLYT